MTLKDALITTFTEKFGQAPTELYFSPGRVNLIGEYTDFNGGHVFPAAIGVGTYAAVSLRDDDEIHAYSENFATDGVLTFDRHDLALGKHDTWVKYARGVISELQLRGYEVPRGFNLAIVGDMPTASGLSSSASLELLVATILNELFDFGIARLDLVKLGQAVENNYLGLQTGIMDQFAVAFGEKEAAMFLDTNTMVYEMVPAEFGDYDLVIMITNKKRELVDSKYNERRAQTSAALADLQKTLPIKTLGDLTNEQFEAAADQIMDDTNRRRARHAVTENQRTIIAKEALTNHDIVHFGELLTASHVSLRDDFEVSGIELDTLVTAALAQPGVLGARMTGAGFGGSAIALVQHDVVVDFIAAVGRAYEDEIGYAATFIGAEIVAGTHRL